MAALFLGAAFCAEGQVVINEVVAANSDRLLQRKTPGYPRLGTTAQWWEGAFDDSQWKMGKGPFGFGAFSGVTFGVDTSGAMQNKLVSLYVRKAFDVSADQAASTNQLQLVTRFNDGFIAFVNGVEVARRNMGNAGMFAYRDQTAFNTNSLPCPVMTIDLGAVSNLLWTGTNTLCIQTHNQLVSSGNFLSMADLRIGGTDASSLVTNNTTWRYFAGVAEPSGGLIDYGIINGVPLTVTWATLSFNDSAWAEGIGPLGYDTKVPPVYTLGVNLKSQMYNRAGSLYSRTLFAATSAEAASTEPLQLTIDYDDGIIVFLNGLEVARRNVGTGNTVTPYNALAASNHAANGLGEVILLGPANTLLAGGDNVLGIQTHNSSLTSSDLIGRVTLSTTGAGGRILARPENAARYFVGTSEPMAIVSEDDEGGDIDYETDAPDSESDWIELYNAGPSAVNLTGWSLTDDSGKPRKWCFPAGSTIPAGGYLVVMATGYDVGPANGATYLHTNFKLSADGEYLGLVDAAGAIASEIAPAFPAQSHFHSYVRTGGGTYVFSDTGTPGAANAGTLFSAITSPPDVSQLGGFYPSAFLLQLAAPDPAASVRYTLDGSEPSETSALYSAPLTISSNTVLRARCFKTGEVPSAVRTCHYLMGQSAAIQSIAALCLSADPVLGIYGPNASGGPANGEGILAIKGGNYYTNYDKYGKVSQINWFNNGDMSAFNMPSIYGRSGEKPAGFEYYPTSGVPLRTDLGLRISSSGWSRPQLVLSDRPAARFTSSHIQKPSFNIFFRGELGESPQDYPFFPESKVTKFEDIRIRAGKNDIRNPFISDELMRRLFIGTGQEGSIGTFCSVYINGVWKGYFNLCEHLRDAFMQQHHNSSAAWDIRQVGTTASGDAVKWNAMIAFLRTNNLTVAANYVQAQNFIDTVNVADYLIVNTYAAMGDWPNNNYVTACERTDAGRWRFYMWDAEMAFGLSTLRPLTYNSFTSDLVIANPLTSTAYIPVIYTLLRASPEFRLGFADRVQKHFFNTGCLVSNSVKDVYVRLRDTINPIMKETTGETFKDNFYNTWLANDTRRMNYFVQLVGQGLWPATLAPGFSQYGGTLAPDTAIRITNLNAGGTIYFTTNGVDPRAVGGGVVGALYTEPIRFPATATLKARVLSDGGEWSPLQEALFLVPVDIPVFLPNGSADWTADANWSSAPLPCPNGTNVAVYLNAPEPDNREISIRVPLIVGSITAVHNESPSYTRLRDRSTGNTLTFKATNGPASVVVNGSGTGYLELKVETETVLDSDLRLVVNNTAGHAEYGALRLRENWRGTGGLIKEGDGVATLAGDGKMYTGATVVKRGVLVLTQPAVPLQSPSVSVTSGGQLRLTSAGTVGAPRMYSFGCPLTLNSLGRGGELPAGGPGVSGGLRYQPDSNDSVAIITNGIVFAGLSGVHVEGSRNTLALSGLLSGQGGFVKTGGGNLILGAQNLRYLAPVIVSNGTLTVTGRVASVVTLAPGGVLTGTGRSGPILGTGTVALDKKVFSAPFAKGGCYAVSFSASGSPSYAVPAASRNGVLRLLTIRKDVVPSVIDVYLDVPELVQGACLRGGIFVESGEGLAAFLAAATVRFFVPDLNGLQVFAGRTYSPYAGDLTLAVTAMPETADFGDGPRQGQVMEVRVAGAPVSYEEWARSYYSLYEEQIDPAVSGPEADPFGFGIPNLLKYAFGFRSGELMRERMPMFEVVDGVPVYAFGFDPGKNDLVYRVEVSPDLHTWNRTLFDSRTDRPVTWDGETLMLADPASGPAISPRQFYRLNVLLTEP